MTIEQVALRYAVDGGFIGLVAAGITIANADDMQVAGRPEADEVFGIGHFPALPVDDAYVDDGSLGTIGQHRRFIGGDDDPARFTGGFYGGGKAATFFIGDGRELSGLIRHGPFEMAIAGHRLFPQAAVVEEELYFVGI